MRVLVTGATGFVGRAVVGQLTMAGHSVIGFARTSKPGQCELRTGDILDQAALDHAVEGADAVCHLAALTLVRQSFAEPVRYFRVNVTGTLNLLDAMNAEARRSGRTLRRKRSPSRKHRNRRRAIPCGGGRRPASRGSWFWHVPQRHSPG